jgi:SAM-dependent methyltransferase
MNEATGRRVDLLRCLRCGTEPLTRQGPVARCNDCGRGYPMLRPGLINFDGLSTEEPRTWLERVFANPVSRRIADTFLPERSGVIDALGLAQGQVLVDLGCGRGELLAQLAGAGLTWRIGVDLALAPLLEAHRQISAGHDLLLLRASAYRLPLRDRCVDRVAALHTLGLLKDPAAALSEIRRVLVPGGRLVIALRSSRTGERTQLEVLCQRAHFEVTQLADTLWVATPSDSSQLPLTAE